MSLCPFLDTLPVEVRLEIYTHLLRFAHPIKSRQFVEGSRDLSILRTNRQIHAEALPLFYDVNTVVVARNDFCPYTDAALRKPLRLDQARRLLVAPFHQSIHCTLVDVHSRCEICRADASGLFAVFAAMPRLLCVTIDMSQSRKEFRRFCAAHGTVRAATRPGNDPNLMQLFPLGVELQGRSVFVRHDGLVG